LGFFRSCSLGDRLVLVSNFLGFSKHTHLRIEFFGITYFISKIENIWPLGGGGAKVEDFWLLGPPKFSPAALKKSENILRICRD